MTISDRTTAEQRQADVDAARHLKGTNLAITNKGELRRLVSAAIKEVGRRMSGGV